MKQNLTFQSERLSLLRPAWGFGEPWTAFKHLHLHHKGKVIKDYFVGTKGELKMKVY